MLPIEAGKYVCCMRVGDGWEWNLCWLFREGVNVWQQNCRWLLRGRVNVTKHEMHDELPAHTLNEKLIETSKAQSL